MIDSETPYEEMTADEIRADVLAAPYASPMSHLYDPRHAWGEDRCFRCHLDEGSHIALTVKKVSEPGRYEPQFSVVLPNGHRIGTVAGSEKRWKWGPGTRAEWYGFTMPSRREAVARLFSDWLEGRSN